MTTTRKEFEPVFQRCVVPALMEHLGQYKLPDVASEWFKKVSKDETPPALPPQSAPFLLLCS